MPVQKTKKEILAEAILNGNDVFVKNFIKQHRIMVSTRFYDTKAKKYYERGLLDYCLEFLQAKGLNNSKPSHLRILATLYQIFIAEKLGDFNGLHVRRDDVFDNQEHALAALKEFVNHIKTVDKMLHLPQDFLVVLLGHIKKSFAEHASLKTLAATKGILGYEKEYYLCLMLRSRVNELYSVALKNQSKDVNVLSKLIGDFNLIDENSSDNVVRFHAMLNAVVTAHNIIPKPMVFTNYEKARLEKILLTVLKLTPDNKLEDQAFFVKTKDGNIVLHELEPLAMGNQLAS